jgi:hypothetical protein
MRKPSPDIPPLFCSADLASDSFVAKPDWWFGERLAALLAADLTGTIQRAADRATGSTNLRQ